MKIYNALRAVLALTCLSGCATQHKVSGPAYGREDLFRRQLAESKPVKEWGYTVQDVRFSEDYHVAVVVFATPGPKAGREEAKLVYDGKRDYVGRMFNLDLPHSNPLRVGEWAAMVADLDVKLPVE